MNITPNKWIDYTLYRLKTHRIWKKISIKWKSPIRHANVSKTWLRTWNKHINTSSLMLLDQLYTLGLLMKPSNLQKEVCWRKVPHDIFLPRPGWISLKSLNTLGAISTLCLPSFIKSIKGLSSKGLLCVAIVHMHVQVHGYFIPSKFLKHPLSGFVVKADYVFPYMYMHLPIPPELVSSPNFWISNIPRYFSFAYAPPYFLHLNKYIKIH